MFLVTGLVLYVKAEIKSDELKKLGVVTSFIIQIIYLVMGSLWLFLLLVFFGIEI
jgi:hypothetical protein